MTNWTKKGQTSLSRDRPLSPFWTVHFHPFWPSTLDLTQNPDSGPRTGSKKIGPESVDRTKQIWTQTPEHGPDQNIRITDWTNKKSGPRIGPQAIHDHSGPGVQAIMIARVDHVAKFRSKIFADIELFYSFLLGWDMSLSGCDDILD